MQGLDEGLLRGVGADRALGQRDHPQQLAGQLQFNRHLVLQLHIRELAIATRHPAVVVADQVDRQLAAGQHLADELPVVGLAGRRAPVGQQGVAAYPQLQAQRLAVGLPVWRTVGQINQRLGDVDGNPGRSKGNGGRRRRQGIDLVQQLDDVPAQCAHAARESQARFIAIDRVQLQRRIAFANLIKVVAQHLAHHRRQWVQVGRRHLDDLDQA